MVYIVNMIRSNTGSAIKRPIWQNVKQFKRKYNRPNNDKTIMTDSYQRQPPGVQAPRNDLPTNNGDLA